MAATDETEFGVYVHIPFCASKCDYCAFATWTDREHLIDEYLAAVSIEVDRAVEASMPPASTVFVGGGTPTLVPPDALSSIIERIPKQIGAEVTVECNPDDVTTEMIRTFVDGGVNRVSIGVQSMSEHVLVSLGRTHDRDNVARAVDAVVDGGLESFNLDLMYGAAGERPADWSDTLDRAIALGPPHISAYGLTVEAGTPLADAPDRHPDDDDQADKYELADDRLAAAGLENYEVSNWARPGHESAHNLLYWRQQNYRGIGCAAHSHQNGRRWWNIRTPDRYIAAIADRADVEASGESLDVETRRFEGLQLLLRTRDGIPTASFEPVALAELDGLVVPHPEVADRVVLTRRGRLMANEISLRFA